MINTYDLYDLYAVFARIRFHPDHPLNEAIMDRIISVLNDRESGELNQIRKAVQSAGKLQKDDIYSFAIVDNIYTYIPFILKDEAIYTILFFVCKEMKNVIIGADSEQIADLADCLHNLPIYIAESKGSIPKMFWQNEVVFYRKKWNERFLSEVQKQFD